MYVRTYPVRRLLTLYLWLGASLSLSNRRRLSLRLQLVLFAQDICEPLTFDRERLLQ